MMLLCTQRKKTNKAKVRALPRRRKRWRVAVSAKDVFLSQSCKWVGFIHELDWVELDLIWIGICGYRHNTDGEGPAMEKRRVL